MYDNTNGTRNTALGGAALANNTTANNNTAGGYHALLDNTTGSGNVSIGVYALDENTTKLSVFRPYASKYKRQCLLTSLFNQLNSGLCAN